MNKKSGNTQGSQQISITIIGSILFREHCEEHIPQDGNLKLTTSCTESELEHSPDIFEDILRDARIILFEKADAGTLFYIRTALKNNKTIGIMETDLDASELQELVQMSNEGSHRILFPASPQVNALPDVLLMNVKPYLIRVQHSYSPQDFHKVSIEKWIAEQISLMRYFFKNDVRQISVFATGVFGERQDVYSIRLEYGPASVGILELDGTALQAMQLIRFDHPDSVICTDQLAKEAFELRYNEGILEKRMLPVLNAGGGIVSMLGACEGKTTLLPSLDDLAAAKDLSRKIIKKIHALQE